MLHVIISPAKQMRARSGSFAARGIPPFPAQTQLLHQRLLDLERQEGAQAIQELWSVSDRLLAQNLDHLHAFAPLLDEDGLQDPALSRLVSPAAFSYVGIQYQSMAPEVMDDDSLEWLQNHLWILSGLYGCARPFDAVQPYRLEMGAKLEVGGARNLYNFWGGSLARTICGPNDCVVNLASVEYSKAVLPHLDKTAHCVTCIFGETLRNKKPVQRSTASKTARGSMVRWMAERRLEDPLELTRFDVGYVFAPELSSKPNVAGNQTLVFMRR